jgi:hypothetical protein
MLIHPFGHLVALGTLLVIVDLCISIMEDDIVVMLVLELVVIVEFLVLLG